MEQPIGEKPSGQAIIQESQTTSKLALKILIWFVPFGIISTILTSLAAASFCLLFCNTTSIEKLFIYLGVSSLLVALFYVPIITKRKILETESTRANFTKTASISIIGYVIIYGMVFIWAFIGNSNPQGWKPSVNERLYGWVQSTIGRIQDAKLNVVNDIKFNEESFKFIPSSSELSLINSNDTILSVTGTFSGLDKLGEPDVMSHKNLVISEVKVGDKVANSEVVKKLKGQYSALGGELDSGLLRIGSGDSQKITTSVSLPKEFAQIIKSDPNAKFTIKVELLSESPYTYQKFNFTTLWSEEIETTPDYLGQFLKDYQKSIYYKLPEQAVKYTNIDKSGNFFTESDNEVNFSVTSMPELTLCCEAPELKVTTTWGNSITAQDYIKNVPWRDEIISQKVSKLGQLVIVEANPTIASPYKAFIYNRFDEIRIYELTGKDSGLDELYNQYIEYYKKLAQFQ